jgi:hypothetical protein
MEWLNLITSQSNKPTTCTQNAILIQPLLLSIPIVLSGPVLLECIEINAECTSEAWVLRLGKQTCIPRKTEKATVVKVDLEWLDFEVGRKSGYDSNDEGGEDRVKGKRYHHGYSAG